MGWQIELTLTILVWVHLYVCVYLPTILCNSTQHVYLCQQNEGAELSCTTKELSHALSYLHIQSSPFPDLCSTCYIVLLRILFKWNWTACSSLSPLSVRPISNHIFCSLSIFSTWEMPISCFFVFFIFPIMKKIRGREAAKLPPPKKSQTELLISWHFSSQLPTKDFVSLRATLSSCPLWDRSAEGQINTTHRVFSGSQFYETQIQSCLHQLLHQSTLVRTLGSHTYIRSEECLHLNRIFKLLAQLLIT